MATKQQQLSISISTINDTDYLGKGISIYLFLSHQRHPAVISKTQTPRRNILRMLTLDADARFYTMVYDQHQMNFSMLITPKILVFISVVIFC
jgi:hypothetical protein